MRHGIHSNRASLLVLAQAVRLVGATLKPMASRGGLSHVRCSSLAVIVLVGVVIWQRGAMTSTGAGVAWRPSPSPTSHKKGVVRRPPPDSVSGLISRWPASRSSRHRTLATPKVSARRAIAIAGGPARARRAIRPGGPGRDHRSDCRPGVGHQGGSAGSARSQRGPARARSRGRRRSRRRRSELHSEEASPPRAPRPRAPAGSSSVRTLLTVSIPSSDHGIRGEAGSGARLRMLLPRRGKRRRPPSSGTSEDDEAVVDEPVHEARVLVPLRGCSRMSRGRISKACCARRGGRRAGTRAVSGLAIRRSPCRSSGGKSSARGRPVPSSGLAPLLPLVDDGAELPHEEGRAVRLPRRPTAGRRRRHRRSSPTRSATSSFSSRHEQTSRK